MAFSCKIDPRKTACASFISVTKNAIKKRDVSIFSQKQSDYANNFLFSIQTKIFLRGLETSSVLITLLVTEIKEAQAVFRGSILHENAKFCKS